MSTIDKRVMNLVWKTFYEVVAQNNPHVQFVHLNNYFRILGKYEYFHMLKNLSVQPNLDLVTAKYVQSLLSVYCNYHYVTNWNLNVLQQGSYIDNGYELQSITEQPSDYIDPKTKQKVRDPITGLYIRDKVYVYIYRNALVPQ
jgi:hypothetical protein